MADSSLNSVGYSINASGQVTGQSQIVNRDEHAFLYTSGAMTDLNALVRPLASTITLTKGYSINNNGLIVADGVDSRTGQTHAYLLTPTGPAPCGAHDGGIFILCPVIQPCSFNTAICERTCGVQCVLHSVVYWAPPSFGGIDPWLNGVLLTTVVPTAVLTPELADNLNIEVNTEPRTQPDSKRMVIADLIHSGPLSPSRALVEGPYVTVTSVNNSSHPVTAITASVILAGKSLRLSLPYRLFWRSYGVQRTR
jgi:probable HAF family extracellular repeat protein